MEAQQLLCSSFRQVGNIRFAPLKIVFTSSQSWGKLIQPGETDFPLKANQNPTVDYGFPWKEGGKKGGKGKEGRNMGRKEVFELREGTSL